MSIVSRHNFIHRACVLILGHNLLASSLSFRHRSVLIENSALLLHTGKCWIDILLWSLLVWWLTENASLQWWYIWWFLNSLWSLTTLEIELIHLSLWSSSNIVWVSRILLSRPLRLSWAINILIHASLVLNDWCSLLTRHWWSTWWAFRWKSLGITSEIIIVRENCWVISIRFVFWNITSSHFARSCDDPNCVWILLKFLAISAKLTAVDVVGWQRISLANRLVLRITKGIFSSSLRCMSFGGWWLDIFLHNLSPSFLHPLWGIHPWLRS